MANIILLQPTDLHLYQTKLTHVDTEILYPLLSTAEKARAQGFLFDTHRAKFIAARATLRKILAQYLSISPTAIYLTENNYGKPILDKNHHPERLFFNLSHAHEQAIYAVSMEEYIGIDIEFTDKQVDFDNIAKRFFSEKESKYIRSIQSAQQKAINFFKIWTAKEAFIKAIGMGLAFPLKAFEIAIQNQQISLESVHTDPEQAKSWSLIPLEVPKKYTACVVVHKPQGDMSIVLETKAGF